MAKRVKVWTGTEFVDLAQSTADLSTYQKSNRTGLNVVVPTGATGGTIGANGAVTIGSAVSSVTIQGAFSAAYENYKIIVTGGVGSTAAYLKMTLGSSTSGYYGSIIYTTYSSSTVLSSQDNGSTSWTYAGETSTIQSFLNVELLQPFIAKQTRISTTMALQSGTGTGSYSGLHSFSTSYSDFTITPTSGTLTGGTIRIYGYNNN